MQTCRIRFVVAVCLISTFSATKTASGVDLSVQIVKQSRESFRSAVDTVAEPIGVNPAPASLSRKESLVAKSIASLDRLEKTNQRRTRASFAEKPVLRYEEIRANKSYVERRTAMRVASRRNDGLSADARNGEGMRNHRSPPVEPDRPGAPIYRTEPSEKRLLIP